MAKKHSAETNEQYTPASVVERVRRVLLKIDLDPASSELANETVQATTIFTQEDGVGTFEALWSGNVFLNPPGGNKPVLSELGIRSNPVFFWSKLMWDWEVEKSVDMAIFLGFTMEVLQTSQQERYPMLRFPFCVPKQRLCFDVPRHEKLRQLQKRLEVVKKASKKARLLEKQIADLQQSTELLVPGESPPHANVLVLVPPRQEQFSGKSSQGAPWVGWEGEVTRRFFDVFSEIGYVRI